MRAFHDLTELGRARRLRQVVAAALERYDLEAARLRLMSNDTNGVFRLDTADGRKLVVRVGLGGAIGHSPGQVEAETGWLAALAAEPDLQVAEPLAARDGRRFVRVAVGGVPDPRNVVVFTWLPGRLLEERLDDDTLEAYGMLAARLHRHGRTHRPAEPGAVARYDEVMPFDEPLVILEAERDLMPPSRRRVFADAVERVAAGIRALQAGGEPMRLLHGDLHPWNVKVNRRGLAPFDFEDLMWGWPVQDVATSLWYLLRRQDYERWKVRFRAGYETVAPWPVPTEDDLRTFLIGRYVVLGNGLVLTPEWRTEAGRLLRLYEEHLRRLLAGRPVEPVSR